MSSLKHAVRIGRLLMLGRSLTLHTVLEEARIMTRELQIHQPYFSSWKNHVAYSFGVHFQAYEGQDGSWEYLILAKNKKLCLANLITFCDDMWECGQRENRKCNIHLL